MSSCLQKKFEAEVERYVGMLFENRVGADAFEACLREQSTPIPYLKKLLEVSDAAAAARDWFSRHGPTHLQPLPLVHYDECEKILCSSDMARHLVSTIRTRCSTRNSDIWSTLCFLTTPVA